MQALIANTKELLGLLGAYGFQMQFERPEEHKTRYQSETTFIDMWVTKRGITLGIYNPKSKTLHYTRPRTLDTFEDVLIEAAKI